jgi:N-acetylglucosamine-6-phosphate deacetylase
LNGDGVHVNDEAVKMCYHNLNKERLILTSDAVVSAGLEYGEYVSYSRAIVSNENGVRYKENNVLMGSNLLVNDIVKRFIGLTGAPVWEAVRCVSYNPCVLLGIDDRKGSIEPGKEADLILLDQDYNVIRNLKQAAQ